MDELNNNHVSGDIACPVDVSRMMTLLSNCQGNGGGKKMDDIRDGTVGFSYLQTRSVTSQRCIECHECGNLGHCARGCPGTENDGDGESNLDKSATPNKKRGKGVGWAG